MSCFQRKQTTIISAATWDFQQCSLLYVWPAKAQTSLRLCAVWSEPLQVAWLFYDCWATDRTPFGVSKLKRRLHRLFWVYSCQNATFLEITRHGSYFISEMYAEYINGCRQPGNPGLLAARKSWPVGSPKIMACWKPENHGRHQFWCHVYDAYQNLNHSQVLIIVCIGLFVVWNICQRKSWYCKNNTWICKRDTSGVSLTFLASGYKGEVGGWFDSFCLLTLYKFIKSSRGNMHE